MTGTVYPMVQEPTWLPSSNQQQYMLTAGIYEAFVWYQSTDQWAALITCEHVAVSDGAFTTLEDAQTWCEERLAELVTGTI